MSRKLPMSDGYNALKGREREFLHFLHVGQRGALMSNTAAEEYVKRAEECERLAGACIADANREILLMGKSPELAERDIA